MKCTTYESDAYKLRRVSGSAYYVLVVQEMETKYYVVKRSGRMGSPYTKAPFFQGWPIGKSAGYDTLDDAFAAAQKVIIAKCNQKGDRKYIPLDDGEVLLEINGAYVRHESEKVS